MKMDYRRHEKIFIDGEDMRIDIGDAGYSIRRLAKEIGVDRRTITRYLNENCMPPYILKQIENVVRPETKTIWVRLGVRVPISEERLFKMMTESINYSGFFDYVLSEAEASGMLKDAVADGESYIPGICFMDHEKWFNEKAEKEMNKYIVMHDFQSASLKEQIRSAGYSQKRIAARLGISDKTLQNYMKNQSMPEYVWTDMMKVLAEDAV